MYYYIVKQDSKEINPISKEIVSVKIALDNKIYSINFKEYKEILKEIFEDDKILKCGYEQKIDYILIKQEGIIPKNFMFDVKIAAYLLNSNSNQYKIKDLASEYLKLDLDEFINSKEQVSQTSLFDVPEKCGWG